MMTNSPALTGTNDLRDISAPVEIPVDLTWLWWTLGALVLAALGYLVWRKWQRGPAPDVAATVPAHLRARQKLRDALALINQPLPFCVAVSDTIRGYLEERFHFRAPERTTEEFLQELRGTSLVTPEQKASLAEFLAQCDLVKFARYEPGQPELQQIYNSAVRLVDETEPPPPAEGKSEPVQPESTANA
jgi:hypothetical protein